MALGESTRRAALDGMARILDAGALEELFTGPEHEAAFLYDLLVDVARGRQSTHYWEVCRTARRRHVTPEYVCDRAAILLASIEERRRTDLYRILGTEALAAPEVLRQRWLEVAKSHHPDVGGDPAAFRRAKEAYEILRDPERRAEYERFWLRAHGPFERVMPLDDVGAVGARPAPVDRRVVMVMKRTGGAVTAEAPVPAPLRDARALLERIAGGPVGGEVLDLVARLEGAMQPVALSDLERLCREVDERIASLERARRDLEHLAALKRQVAAV
jgi:hypothetical protein